jgi:hypothetical protein
MRGPLIDPSTVSGAHQWAALTVLTLVLLAPANAAAIRPFITDDGRVVGGGRTNSWWAYPR